MKGWRCLVAKDWKIIFRNRLLLVVLILYPFLIMGIIGAAFYDTGRPVPLGLVNLDRVEPGRLAWVAVRAKGGVQQAQSLVRVGTWAGEYDTQEEAIAALEGGSAGLLSAVETPEGGLKWSGRRASKDEIGQLFAQLESNSELEDYGSWQRALASLEDGTNNAVIGLREEDYPFLGETVWLDQRNYDASLLIQTFSSGVSNVVDYASEDDAREGLKKGRVDAVIVLPRRFIHDLKALNRIAEVGVILDQSNLVKAEFAETNIRGFLSRVNEGVVKSKMTAVIAGLYSLVGGGDFFGTQITGLQQIKANLEKIQAALAGNIELRQSLDSGIELADTVINDIEDAMAYLRGTALPIQLDVSSVAGRTLSTKDAVVPSLIALSILWTGVLSGAILMVSEEEEGMAQRLRLSDIGAFSIAGSKILLATAIVFAQSVVMLLIAVAILGAFASHLALALLVMLVACFACIGIGLFIAAFARQVAGAVLLSVLVTFPLIFMTGAVFPLSQMPDFMQWIARAVPVTYAIEALSGVMLRAETVADVGWEIAVLCAFGLGLLGMASVLLRRRSA
jgi:ABC-2 type transport system permease protein